MNEHVHPLFRDLLDNISGKRTTINLKKDYRKTNKPTPHERPIKN